MTGVSNMMDTIYHIGYAKCVFEICFYFDKRSKKYFNLIKNLAII